MKHVIFSITALFFLMNVGIAQQREATISFEKEKWDFGTINENDGNVSYKFAFKNTGNTPLIISDVKASCGCTTPDWTKSPITPGGSGYVEVTYNPANRPGAFSKTIRVTTNASNSSVVLTIEGNVNPKEKLLIDNYPQVLGSLNFRSTRVGFAKIMNTEEKTDSFLVYNNSSEAITMTFVDVPKYIKLVATPAKLAPGKTGQILVTFDGKNCNEWDFVMDRIKMKQNTELITSGYLSVSANLREDFSALTESERAKAPVIEFESTTFNFGTITEGESVSYTYKFKNTGKSNLIIRKIKASCGCTATQLDNNTIAPGETGSITVTFNSRGKKGQQNKSISVTTNDPDDARSRVSLWIKGKVNEVEGSN